MNPELTFFEVPVGMTVGDIAARVYASVREGDDAGAEVTSVGPIEAAASHSLTFLDNPKYLPALADTQAKAVICSKRYVDQVPEGIVALVSAQPYHSFAMAAAALFPSAMRPLPVIAAGISSGAHIHPSALVEDGATVEAGAVVGAGAEVGRGAYIGPTAVIGPKVRIGRDSSISAGATVIHALIGDRVIIHSGVRIGGDGFGYAMGPGGHLKIPQIGRVVIQDDVEIGANSCIDRGSNRDTIIGEGSKLDDMIMVGHNVTIGRHCVIVSQTGIAGSAQLGDYCILGGRVAVNGHIKIGNGAQLAGLSGVGNDVPPGAQWGGVPARPIRHWMREIGRLRREAMATQKKGS